VPKILFASFGTAYTGGIPKNIKKGVIKKPPPTPNKPDKIPTAKLKKNITGRSILTPAIGRKKSITTNYYSKIAKSMI
jgi:hypothetical protein